MISKKLTIVHLSDFHFSAPTKNLKQLFSNNDIFSKRFIGLLNHKYNRKHYFKKEIRNWVFDQLPKIPYDYLVITGDFTNVSQEEEFISARKGLEPFLIKKNVIITHGNHDRYIPSSHKDNFLIKYFSDCFPYNQEFDGDINKKFIELDQKTVLLEIDMAFSRPWYSSRGKVCADLNDYKKILDAKYQDFFKIVIGHYPVFLHKGITQKKMHSLIEIEKMQEFLATQKIDLHLHGHIHKSWSFSPIKNNPLICVNSGGSCRYPSGKWSGFHVIEIEDKKIKVNKIEPNFSI